MAAFDQCENTTLVLGYFRDGDMRLFAGEQTNIDVELRPDDQLVLLSKH